MVPALFVLGLGLIAADAERVAVVTVGKEGVDAGVTGNVWFALERKLSRFDRLRIIDAGEQTLKLRADSGAAVDACRLDVTCLASIGTRLGVDRLLAAQVSKASRGFAVKVLVVDVAARRISKELTAEARASGDLDTRVDSDLKRVFSTPLSAPRAGMTVAAPPVSAPPSHSPVPRQNQVVVVKPNAPLSETPPSVPRAIAAAPKPAPPPLQQQLVFREESAYVPTPLGGSGIAVAVLSLATIAAAIGVGASGQQLSGRITDRTSQLSAERLQNDANTRSTIANVGYALGGAGFCLGATLFAVDIWRFKNR